MKVFFDTSSLAKLYFFEEGSEFLKLFFKENIITKIYLSELAKLEFCSVVWRKYRKREIGIEVVNKTLSNFQQDWDKFTFINKTDELIEKGRMLMSKYGEEGLRTLDSIQLASAIKVKGKADAYFTSDKLLKHFFEEEKLSIIE